MANHPSAEKRNRQRLERTVRNKSITSSVRTAVKKARLAIETGDAAVATVAVKTASVALAKASSKGVVPDKTASRVTSRIQSQLHKLSSQG